MAVQAQYPSNLLPFCRAEPEMKKPTPAGFAGEAQAGQDGSGFLEQHSALFFPGVVSNLNNSNTTNNYNNNANSHPRKRARDAAVAAGAGGGGFFLTAHDLNSSSTINNNNNGHQHHPVSTMMAGAGGLLAAAQPMLPQLVTSHPSFLGGGGGAAALSQLHPQQQQHPKPHGEEPFSVVSTGLCLAPLEDQMHKEQQPQPQPLQHLLPLSDELAAQMREHKEEVERFLAVQSEHLRRSITESRRRHFRSLVSAAEESASRKLREKQSELDRLSRTRADLEARAARLAAESAAWQAKARAGEAAAAALRAQLDRAAADLAQRQAQAGGSAAAAADGGCAAAERPAGSDAASACVDPRREEMERQQAAAAAAAAAGSSSSRARRPHPCPVSCRQCGTAGASVVLLPCRHLCLCAPCSQDAALPAVCPVCFCARSVAVEVFFC